MRTSPYHRFSNVLFAYLRHRLKAAIAFLLVFFIFFLLFWLCGYDMGIYLYAIILSCTVVGIMLVYDLSRYWRRDRELQNLYRSIDVTLELMPKAAHLLEQDYQDLIQALFIRKQVLALEADRRAEETSDYYTMWAHQIKTPISAMRLLLQSARAEHPGLPAAEMEQELFKIEQYVEMVLQYLRLESMNADLVLREYPLEDLVKQAVKRYSSSFIYRKISLRMEPLDCPVLTDEKWTVFVLEQLLSNALKYTPKGEIRIYMDSAKKNTLVIEDTGIGIQEEDIPRIFDRGFTGYNGRMDKKSTGIGLYLCRRILTKLGHSIRIESQVGKGTKVFVCFAREKIEIQS